jgi:hypothetical protein
MPVTAEDRAAWKAAEAGVIVIEAERATLLEPTNERFDAAKAQLDEIEERTGMPTTCEGCGEPIFPGDKHMPGDDGDLCYGCAPTYADLLTSPGSFTNADELPMTPDQARALYDAHIAGGGKPEDSMAEIVA